MPPNSKRTQLQRARRKNEGQDDKDDTNNRRAPVYTKHWRMQQFATRAYKKTKHGAESCSWPASVPDAKVGGACAAGRERDPGWCGNPLPRREWWEVEACSPRRGATGLDNTWVPSDPRISSPDPPVYRGEKSPWTTGFRGGENKPKPRRRRCPILRMTPHRRLTSHPIRWIRRFLETFTCKKQTSLHVGLCSLPVQERNNAQLGRRIGL
jgi:hypothetical protein